MSSPASIDSTQQSQLAQLDTRHLWGARIYRRRKLVLALTVVTLAVAGAVLAHGGRLSVGVFDNAESKRAEELTASLERPGDASFVIIFGSDTLTVDTPEFTSALRDAVSAIKSSPDVVSVLSPVDAPGMAAMRFYSADAHHALAAVTLAGDLPVPQKNIPLCAPLVCLPVR